MRKLGLLPKLILGIVLGILVGMSGFEFLIRALGTFNNIFGNFLGFVIPLIIIGFVAAGIADLGKAAGKLLVVTVLIAYLSTILAGSLAYFVDSTLFQKLHLENAAEKIMMAEANSRSLAPFFTVDMPPIMGVMTALLMAFTLGIGAAVIDGEILKRAMKEFQAIVEKIIVNIIIPLLPLHICGIFANMTFEGKTAAIMSVFVKVFIIIIALHFVILIFQYAIAGGIAGANPFRLLKTMMSAYLTAVGTQSSAATIPVTLEQTKKNGVSDGVADFVVPLCATIHLSGSTITLTSCSLALMTIYGMPHDFSLMFGFILMLGITMVAAPGVPGGAVMAALGLLGSMLGFSPELQSLMIALYLTQDSFGTACNVTGDGAIAIIVNRIAGFKLGEKKAATANNN
ncbi:MULTISPECIES: dicarboxylate/amino acid:cation symporter [Fusobacterium]|jgi:Na+/H+-dicarboxylate symporter|uniref:Dicarboxylate/amino acid:cation symporter n=1 Tax=Fusobacterium hominis TaxID=2764326 RepID=A0A7G9GUB2_9FUSO|nr:MULTISPECIES: dicarboxylate/amino acid:cation symporter [Fusobacterium]QNM14394.1 dicarboxylate/amino acid:cation symporter [Fusobacterium hominis]